MREVGGTTMERDLGLGPGSEGRDMRLRKWLDRGRGREVQE